MRVGRERLKQEKELEDEAEVFQTATFLMSAGNRLMRKGGYSPAQWVLGEDIRLPSDLDVLTFEPEIQAPVGPAPTRRAQPVR